MAGNGESGFSGDGGPATEASLDSPSNIFGDKTGNLFIFDTFNARIRKVDAAGIITTVVGNGEFGFSGDGGPATEASILGLSKAFVDGAGHLFIADWNERIRKVDGSGIITTVAGNGESGFSGDGGPATEASLTLSDILVDNTGNLFIVDERNSRIRKVDGSGIITTVAGNGESGFSGDGGPATEASLTPSDMFVDPTGNLFILDAANFSIRKVDPSGIITTVVGQKKVGLISKTVSAFLLDQEGMLWIGTDRGLSRFDGENWHEILTPRNSGLVGQGVGSMFQDKKGGMWFGTRDGPGRGRGVSHLDIHGQWERFTTRDHSRYNATLGTWESVEEYGEGQGLFHNRVNSITQDNDGAMWFGTGRFLGGGAANRYDGTWETFLEGNTVMSVFVAQDGAIWAGTGEAFGSGVYRYDGEEWLAYTTDDGLISNNVSVIWEDFRNGTLWFGTEEGVGSFRRPSISLVQTVIAVPPPTLLGSDRFFFECRGFEIGSNRQPPLAFALVETGREPNDTDWTPFAVSGGFRGVGLSEGGWTFYVRAIDRNGNIDPTPGVVSFTVDLTAPTVVISSPKQEAGISGQVDVQGSAFDRSRIPDLEAFILEYAEGTEASQIDEGKWIPIGEPQTSPVENSILGSWHTEDLPDGNYVLRIKAKDKLGHGSVDNVPVVIVSALAQVDEKEGGRVTSSRGTVDLMIPPNGLKGGGEVQIAFVPEREQVGPPNGATGTRIVYRVGPGNLTFNKRSTLTIGYDLSDIAGIDETDLAVFELSGETWNRLGGTVDAGEHKISVMLQKAGTYGLFEALDTGGILEISDIACQPRIISPSGTLYPATTDISFKLGTSATVNVRIYSVSGNLIREISKDRRLNAGLNTVQWNGRDRNGQAVTDGIYIVVIEAGGKAANKTVAVLNR